MFFPFRIVAMISIVAGILFFTPFFFRFLLFFLFVGFMIKLVRWSWYSRYGYNYGSCAYHRSHYRHQQQRPRPEKLYNDDEIVPSDIL